MPVGPRRFPLLLVLVAGFIGILYFTSFHAPRDAGSPRALVGSEHDHTSVPQGILTGHAIAPKLGNETAKKQLGNAAWRVLHTTFARFPDKPTKEESQALESYIHLFQRLYPCGECAEHFGQLLKKFPPQVSSRSAAAVWGCHVHNEVNKRLHKELFDCSNIGDFYDCGCADKDDEKKSKPEMSEEQKAKLSGANGRSFNEEALQLDQKA